MGALLKDSPDTAVMDKLSDLRKSYERGELDESHASHDPLAQFRNWFQHALDAKVPEPNAMTLATVGGDGRPSTRVGAAVAVVVQCGGRR